MLPDVIDEARQKEAHQFFLNLRRVCVDVDAITYLKDILNIPTLAVIVPQTPRLFR